MNQNLIPDMLGRLSHEIILVCDEHGTIHEANPIALNMFGLSIIGRHLQELLFEKSVDKGNAFLSQLFELEMNSISNTWELYFNQPDSEPIACNIRGGKELAGYWIIIGACEPPELTAIYYEVLAMNSELTNLIRQLSKEQARLMTRLNELLQRKD